MKRLLRLYALTCIALAIITVLTFTFGKWTYPMPVIPKEVAEAISPTTTPTPTEGERLQQEFISIYLSDKEPVTDRERLIKDIKLAYTTKPSAELSKKLEHMDTNYDYVGGSFRGFLYTTQTSGKPRRGPNTYRCTLTGSKIGVNGEYVSQEDYQVISDITEHDKVCVDLEWDTETFVKRDVQMLILRLENGEFSLPPPAVGNGISADKEVVPPSNLAVFFSTPTWFDFFAKPFLVFGILAIGILAEGLIFAFGTGFCGFISRKLKATKKEGASSPKDMPARSLFDEDE